MASLLVGFFLVFEDRTSYHLLLSNERSSYSWQRLVPPDRLVKIGATLGVFVLPILKAKFGVPAVLGMMAVVSALGLIVTLVFGNEDTE